MTIETPLWMQAGTYSARQDRSIIDQLFTEGVIDPGGGSLAVTERAAGANNSVDVAVGRAVVDGDDQADQGSYLVRVTGVENVALSPAPGADKRIDLVVLLIRDENAGGEAGDDAILAVVEGAVAAAPVVPVVPDSAIPLAQVLRTAGDVSVLAGMITDARPVSAPREFTAISNFEIMTTAERNALVAPDDGRTIFNETTGQVEVRVAGAWSALALATHTHSGGTQIASGTFAANGAASRTIALPFTPKLVFLWREGQSFQGWLTDSGCVNHLASSMVSDTVQVPTTNGFIVSGSSSGHFNYGSWVVRYVAIG